VSKPDCAFPGKEHWAGTCEYGSRKIRVRFISIGALNAIIKSYEVVGVSALDGTSPSRREENCRFTELFETLQEALISAPGGPAADANPALVSILVCDEAEILALEAVQLNFDPAELRCWAAGGRSRRVRAGNFTAQKDGVRPCFWNRRAQFGIMRES